ncbi:MAG TPA: NAD(P)/FAD-dependent oxidoreductase, partial [Opitutaceae bacterium]|nr:NAD(P)/FAD-dependent oxidoreductase [Opitutaceae bacterium]
MSRSEARPADFVVVGAGAAGLAAARILAGAGAKVCLLEARHRIGGRIWTKRPAGWPRPLELGAEFIHGGNPSLWSLVRRAGLVRQSVPDIHWDVSDGEFRPLDDAWSRINAALRGINPAFSSSFGEWLKLHPHELSENDREVAKNFVEGFHAAPLRKMSAQTLAAAARAPEEKQFRLSGGYDEVIAALRSGVPRARLELRLGTVVKKIEWSRRMVRVTARSGRWRASGAIITVPLGVLQAPCGERGAISFVPPLAEKQRLWRQLETGHACRVVLHLDESFWEDPLLPAALRSQSGRGFGFLHGRQRDFPVWWSQAPAPLLVGWMGGPRAADLAGMKKKEVFRRALQALGRLLQRPEKILAEKMVSGDMHDWSSDPFSRGAYSFSQAGNEDFPRRLGEAVAETLFFAGEATADPLELGTVHGALSSG